MEQLNGKILVFSDMHLGLKGAQKNRLQICVDVIKSMISYIKKNDIKTIIFCGDWNHVRVSTENNVLNIGYKLMSALAKLCHVYVIVGNHDIYMKNSVDINSLVYFKSIPNVTLIDKTTQLTINNSNSVLVPWLGAIDQYEHETFDMMFGHFEVSQKYLIKSYIEDQRSCTSEQLQKNIDDEFADIIESPTNDAGDYIGDFVDIVKKSGVIFSGHIHKHREFMSKGRRFVMVGDPYQQNFGEKDYDCGFYVINDDNSYQFVPIDNVPRHVEIRMSLASQDDFDFSCVKNNIIHKIYDVDIDPKLESKITQKINDMQPYEELLPEYEVDIDYGSKSNIVNESIKLIKKSKMEYVKNYVNNIDKNVLNEQDIDPTKLYSVLEEYYNNVIGED